MWKVDTRSTTNKGGGTIKLYFELILDNSTVSDTIDLRAIIDGFSKDYITHSGDKPYVTS